MHAIPMSHHNRLGVSRVGWSTAVAVVVAAAAAALGVVVFGIVALDFLIFSDSWGSKETREEEILIPRRLPYSEWEHWPTIRTRSLSMWWWSL